MPDIDEGKSIITESNPMVDFFERLGHRVVRSENSWWYEIQPRVFLSIPYYKPIEISDEETKELMEKYKLRAIRFPTTLSSFGFLSNITINTNKDYDMPSLHSKARNQTRRGLESCVVEQMDFDDLYEKGLSLNKSTAKRQGRESYYCDTEYWSKYCQAAKATEGVDAWGSFVEGRLASFLVTIKAVGNWSEWVLNHSDTNLLSIYPNNVLAFTVAQHLFQNQNIEGICYGLGSLEETKHLDHFKKRMGWAVVPIKQRLVFSSKMRIVFSFAQEPCLKLLCKCFPKNYSVRKASAMIRLYRQQTYEEPSADSQ